MTRPGWDGAYDPTPFARDELEASTLEAARRLLGAVLVSDVDETPTIGVVVESEAYVGAGDPASHANEKTGRTRRNAAMFGPAGHAYVYRIYGLHHCLNVVTGPTGKGLAVLIRALHPIEGIATMAARRGRSSHLCDGPGRLCQALGVTTALDGHAFDRPPLRLLTGWSVPPERVETTGRVGIRQARDWPLRFLVRGEPSVSRAKTAKPRHSAEFRAALERMERA